MQNAKQHISLFFVALMLLFKFAGLHAFEHQVDDVDVHQCEICEITTVANYTPAFGNSSIDLPQKPSIFQEQKVFITQNVFVFNNKFLSSFLHTRPPPFIS